jgi:hypothetical protein
MIKYISVKNRISVQEVKINGLSVFKVLYLGKQLNQFMSREQANTKAQAYREKLSA